MKRINKAQWWHTPPENHLLTYHAIHGVDYKHNSEELALARNICCNWLQKDRIFRAKARRINS
jgi:hypothetical protein